MTNSEIRARARDILDHKIFGSTWLMSIAVTLIIGMISGFASSMTCGIGAYLVAGPLSVGMCIAFLKLLRERNGIDIGSAFDGVKDFGSNLVLGLMTNIIVSLWSLLFIIPGIVKAYSYFLVYYIKADHPEYGWRECLNESERLMRGNRLRLIGLQFSFLGWIFLSIFTCGISALWVNAYMQASYAVFYEDLKDRA